MQKVKKENNSLNIYQSLLNYNKQQLNNHILFNSHFNLNKKRDLKKTYSSLNFKNKKVLKRTTKTSNIIKYPINFFKNKRKLKNFYFSHILLITAQKKNTFINILKNDGSTINTYSIGNFNIIKSERKKAFYLKEIIRSMRPLIRLINKKRWILIYKGTGPGRRMLHNIFWQLQWKKKKKIVAFIDYTHIPFNSVRLKRAPRK